MKWETIKDKCARDAYTRIKSGHFMTGEIGVLGLQAGIRTLAARDTAANKAFDCIKNWDIRCYTGLKQLYPSIFPTGTFEIEYTDQGFDLVKVQN